MVCSSSNTALPFEQPCRLGQATKGCATSKEYRRSVNCPSSWTEIVAAHLSTYYYSDLYRKSVDNFHSFNLRERASAELDNKRRHTAQVLKDFTNGYLGDDSTRGSMPSVCPVSEISYFTTCVGKVAEYECSSFQRQGYCSQRCQVDDWEFHKHYCNHSGSDNH